MNKFKRAALITLGVIASGFMVFSFATIGLAVLGIMAVLMVIGLLAQPFLPKSLKKPSIIIVDSVSTKSTTTA